MGTRARNFASRKLLASSSPVDTQLFIHIRATSSYSSARAGRMIGDIGWNPGVDDRQENARREAIAWAFRLQSGRGGGSVTRPPLENPSRQRPSGLLFPTRRFRLVR